MLFWSILLIVHQCVAELVSVMDWIVFREQHRELVRPVRTSPSRQDGRHSSSSAATSSAETSSDLVSCYYAVRMGRRTGIFTSLSKCRRKVVGYRGA